MNIPNVKTEPVAYAGVVIVLANIIVAFVAKYGIVLDPTAVAAVMTPFIGALLWYARSKVHPAIKVQEQIAAGIASATRTHITVPPKDVA